MTRRSQSVDTVAEWTMHATYIRHLHHFLFFVNVDNLLEQMNGERSQKSSKGITNLRGNVIEGIMGHTADVVTCFVFSTSDLATYAYNRIGNFGDI